MELPVGPTGFTTRVLRFYGAVEIGVIETEQWCDGGPDALQLIARHPPKGAEHESPIDDVGQGPGTFVRHGEHGLGGEVETARTVGHALAEPRAETAASRYRAASSAQAKAPDATA